MNFEQMKADLVIQGSDGSRQLEYRVYPKVPELEVPEDVSLTTDQDETTLILPDDIHFDFGESFFKEEAIELIDHVSNMLDDIEAGTIIEIEDIPIAMEIQATT
ncbi:hypothetical protein [Halalkalibacter wakoensis]|uniref:hypothetical protein n=1 Tax=Halalkalibacter wakoensis TaxID=127891 RepID=UPI000AA7AEBB|nr:hypothetical protein [Halalkalibacter wakoensis]